MSELREWQKPLSQEKIDYLTVQFARLKGRFEAGRYSPAMGTTRRPWWGRRGW